MTYRTKFILFIVFLHLCEISLGLLLFNSHRVWFIAVEALFLISLAVSIYFLISSTKPLQLINTGIESIKDKDFNMRLVKVGQKEIDSLIDIYNQMLDTLRKERKFHQEQNIFLDRLIQASPAGIIILDLEGCIKAMNPASEKLLKISGSESKGRKLTDLNSSIIKELSELEINETKVIQSSGINQIKVHKSYFLNNGFRNFFFTIEELSDEIYQAELAAYEKVIRTISHEFSNSVGPINSILNSLLFYSQQLAENDQTEYKNAIDVAIGRNIALNGFVKRYTEVFKLPAPLKEIKDVNEIVGRIGQIFHYECSQRTIQIKLQLCTQPLLINVDVNQFELAISNIIKNAIDSIDSIGIIEIITTLSPRELIIQNNGQAIAADVQKKLFSPFFSTKKNGQGIGLTLVREILQSHGFTFSLETLSNGITQFRIIIN